VATKRASAAKKAPARKKGLSDQHKRFVAEYLIDQNATAAYRRAGYAAKGHSAEVNAERLLRNADVRAAVDAGLAATLNRLEITREKVLKEIARIAFSDKRKVLVWGPAGVKLRPSDELDDDAAAVVAEVSETISASGGSLKLKTHDKVKALELLGRHLALFTDKTEMSGPGGGPIETRGVRELTRDELIAIASGSRG
jgi:phage terminase small subunit